MDRLMDYADEPPTDPFAEMADTKETLPPYVGPEGTSTHDFPLQQMDADQSAATVSTPLESASAFLEANDSATSAAGDVEIPWPSPPELPQMHAHGSVVLRIRLPSGESFTKAFLLEHCLGDVFSCIHHYSGVKLSTRQKYELVLPGIGTGGTYSDAHATLGSLGLSGRLAVNLREMQMSTSDSEIRSRA